MDQLHVSYSDIMIMPVQRFRELTKWKIKRNEEQKRKLEERMRSA